jgi:hypothetical protein
MQKSLLSQFLLGNISKCMPNHLPAHVPVPIYLLLAYILAKNTDFRKYNLEQSFVLNVIRLSY